MNIRITTNNRGQNFKHKPLKMTSLVPNPIGALVLFISRHCVVTKVGPLHNNVVGYILLQTLEFTDKDV